MATPTSNPTSYCTPAEFLQRVDPRQVGDLVGLQDVRVPGELLLVNPEVQAALDDAAGEVEAACLVAKRYAPEDLAALTGVSARLLKRLVARLAFWNLQADRRPS